MPFASTIGAGDCLGVPDVCKTPGPDGPESIPYSNAASLAMAHPATCSSKVFIVNQPAATIETVITMSSGDELGVDGGVVSDLVKGPCRFKIGSSVVMIEGNPAAYLGSTIGHNGVASANQPMGAQISPSQTVVIVSP
jgi:uncharacterized Zn-binding protein involved in type VI secretion